MDQHISGSGTIGSGEYDNIHISGSGNLIGAIRCKSIHSSGSITCDGKIICDGEFQVSGSAKVCGSVKCGSFKVSGGASFGDELIATGKISVSGSAKAEKGIKCSELHVSGTLKSFTGIEAESVQISGGIVCQGLLNAEKIDIDSNGGVKIDSIGGGEIRIGKTFGRRSVIERMPLMKKLMGSRGMATVENSIEGDIIAVENLRAATVTGRIVAIGEGCDIDLVRYSEQLEISPKATVRKQEKITL